MNINHLRNKTFLAIAMSSLLACQHPQTETPEPLAFSADNAGKVAVVITGWGETKGFDKEFRMGLGRAQNGERQITKDQACSENFVGKFPFRSQMGLVPFALAYPVKGVEAAYDSLGLYTKQGDEYVSIIDSTVRLKASEIPAVDGIIKSITESTFFPGRSVGAIDPRDGRELLPGMYQIGETSRKPGLNPLALPNGISDFDEIRMASSIADMHFMYEDMTPRPNVADDHMTEVAIDVVKDYFGDRVDLRFGAYSATPGLTRTEEDVTMDFYQAGYRQFILTRETTDNNHYANNFMTRGIIEKRLCNEGVLDQVTIKQTRQVGRTPEYNTALLEILRPHLEKRKKGEEIAIIYTTYGMPFPGSNDRGPFAVAHPFAADVYHENAFLNHLSFKRYAMDEFGKDYQLRFNHKGKDGDLRTDSYHAYAMFPSSFYGKPNDPLRFPTIRENIDRAKKAGEKEIIVLLSHWNYNNTDNMLGMRKLNNIPFNSREDVANQKYWQQWCEAEESFQPVACDSENAISLSFTEVFDPQATEFGIGYGNRIRGTVEQFGLLPEGVEVLARGDVSELNGGEVAVTEGVHSGVKLVVAADPEPNKPESFNWKNYEAFVDPAKPFVSAWFDFEAYIATQPVDSSLTKELLSAPVLLGPYRTIVNKPARLTLAFNPEQLESRKIQPVIYNEVSKNWDPVYDVAGGEAATIDFAKGTISFDVQVLGLFALKAE
ncbi:hypothetical protein [Oceanicoccus sp. KOV_DT_Chl]|uniref:hypothetical protein n=1 Tax=Oceanicoccus sp. KOV_DT_Chl TaxID=1904639 RepID=UPI000C7C2D81|nr:hypothetical protein [Oceanicoccus sp. KOV_DT_Chl]